MNPYTKCKNCGHLESDHQIESDMDYRGELIPVYSFCAYIEGEHDCKCVLFKEDK